MKQVVYLAGGMKSGWQDKVHERFGERVHIRDPRRHGLTDEELYTRWDIKAIAESQIIFAYLEKDNPSGYGLMLEIGVAWAIGPNAIIFVDEKPEMRKYTGMAHVLADFNFDNLEDGMRQLDELIKDWEKHVSEAN